MPTDWVVNDMCYGRTDPNLGQIRTLTIGEVMDYPLTVTTAATSVNITGDEAGSYALPESNDRLLVLGVRGAVHALLKRPGAGAMPAIGDGPYWVSLTLRLRVAESPPLHNVIGPAPYVPAYDLEEAYAANEEFLWEHRITWSQYPETFWSDLHTNRAMPLEKRVNVSTRTKRRLDSGQYLVLTAQFSSLITSPNYVPNPNLAVVVAPRLRTFVGW